MRELSLHILDVLQNAREAGAGMVELAIEEDLQGDRLLIDVKDDGRGMQEETVRRVLDPFYTSRKTRHVGLGLPLLAAAAERCDGRLEIESAPGRGTRVRAAFRHSHVDRAPLGNIGSTLLSFLMGEPTCDLVYLHRRNGRTFRLDTREVRRELGPVPLSHPMVREWLESTIEEAEKDLTRSAAGSP
ncbi:MAG: ATP-binding protein [bacterium]